MLFKELQFTLSVHVLTWLLLTISSTSLVVGETDAEIENNKIKES